jgi:hypothetical protein
MNNKKRIKIKKITEIINKEPLNPRIASQIRKNMGTIYKSAIDFKKNIKRSNRIKQIRQAKIINKSRNKKTENKKRNNEKEI